MFGIRRCEFITLRSASNSAMMLDFWRLLADNAMRSQTGSILTYLPRTRQWRAYPSDYRWDDKRSEVQHAG